jgi:hypothetical protein
LKFLEEYCADCLEITNVSGNGDGTINLTVQITHPFPDNPEYTGFDVKGIIMFTGSHELPWWDMEIFPFGTSGDHHYFYVSWALKGDPEVLNPDGYSVHWSPYWESGSTLPIFNYYEGKYTNGTPTANINAYRNFYSDENRHMFAVDNSVYQTYHISLPPGPVTAGYAVEALWVPPSVEPVTNPVTDFPWSANQPEPYYLQFVVNDGEPIADADWNPPSCHKVRFEYNRWPDMPDEMDVSRITYPPWNNGESWIVAGQSGLQPDQCSNPPTDVIWLPGGSATFPIPSGYENGIYRGVAVLHAAGIPPFPFHEDYFVYDIFDFTIDTQ